MYVHKKKVGGTNPTGLVVESEVEVDSYPPVSLPSSLTFLDPFAAKKSCFGLYYFRMSKSPATPQKPGLLLHTQKAFLDKYSQSYLSATVFVKGCDVSYGNRIERLRESKNKFTFLEKINLQQLRTAN